MQGRASFKDAQPGRTSFLRDRKIKKGTSPIALRKCIGRCGIYILQKLIGDRPERNGNMNTKTVAELATEDNLSMLGPLDVDTPESN